MPRRMHSVFVPSVFVPSVFVPSVLRLRSQFVYSWQREYPQDPETYLCLQCLCLSTAALRIGHVLFAPQSLRCRRTATRCSVLIRFTIYDLFICLFPITWASANLKKRKW